MNLEHLTNTEILYHSDLKNKILVQIPNTSYHVLCTFVKTKQTWTVHLMELLSTKRKKIAENLTRDSVSTLLQKVMYDGKNMSLKHSKSFTGLLGFLRKQIKSIQHKQNAERNP